mgnify:CR=1 FL=1
MAKYSPLLDPLILNSDVATPLTPIWVGLSKINWKNALVNFIIPFILLLIVAFTLRSRYDKKKQLYNDYYVVDPPTKSIIF